MSAKVTKEHCALWNKLYNLAFNECFGGDSSDAQAAQLIADSEAEAVEAYAASTRELLQSYMTERDQLRAERDKLLGYYHEIVAELGDDLALKCIRDLRAEVERLKAQVALDDKAKATMLKVFHNEQARAERAEASLHALRLVCGTTDAEKFSTWVDRANARAESAEHDCRVLICQLNDAKAELAAERARLDWLLRKDGETSDGEQYEIEVSVTYNGNTGAAPRIPATRAAIDAAIKEETK